MERFSSLTTDEVADGICLRAGRIAAAEAELMPWIAEFDRREGWAGSGLLSCAHWLSWKVGLSLGTAREQVRVARRLEDLPELAKAFAAGRVSYSKVRAITRVAEPGDGIDWVDLARCSTASQLEQVVRGLRRARAIEQAEQDPEAAAWSWRTRVRYEDDGSFALTIRGPAELLPVIEAGLEAKKAELQRAREAEAAKQQAEAVQEVLELADVSAETSPTVQDDADADPDRAAADGQAGELAEVSAEVPPASSDAEPPVGGDEPAPGWPVGTTVRDVREATRSFFALQDALRREQAALDPQLAADQGGAGPRADGSDVSAETPPPPARVTDAEVLAALAQDALAAEQRTHPHAARRRRPELTAQVDPISGWGRLHDGELLPPASLRAVMRTLPGRQGLRRLRPLMEADLRRHDLGRTSREVSPALRELLGAIDGQRCRFPGCTRRKKLHAHHVEFWAAGGPTDLGNLVLVCARHHTLIHAQGFQLLLHPDRRLEARTADGTRLLHHPAQPWGDPADLALIRDVSEESLSPDHIEPRIDLGYIVNVLLSQAS